MLNKFWPANQQALLAIQITNLINIQHKQLQRQPTITTPPKQSCLFTFSTQAATTQIWQFQQNPTTSKKDTKPMNTIQVIQNKNPFQNPPSTPPNKNSNKKHAKDVTRLPMLSKTRDLCIPRDIEWKNTRFLEEELAEKRNWEGRHGKRKMGRNVSMRARKRKGMTVKWIIENEVNISKYFYRI